MEKSHLKSRVFTMDDQLLFSELSGDYNPIHIDEIAARRLLFGAPVVHGLNATLWALNCILDEYSQHITIQDIRVTFPKPIKVNNDVKLVIVEKKELSYIINLTSNDIITTTLEFTLKLLTKHKKGVFDYSPPTKAFPVKLTENQIKAAKGTIKLSYIQKSAERLFPNVVRCLTFEQIASLLATTRLVGGICPGLNSVFSELNLSILTPNQASNFNYNVNRVDPRFGMVFINIVTPSMSGLIKAFIRPEPIRQTSFLLLKDNVSENEFCKQRALVIGGSRGLGEVAVKLLSAGGADVKFSFHQGKSEADDMVLDIKENGGKAECFKYNVLEPHLLPSDIADEWRPTHLYYFATPHIFSGDKGEFSTALFDKFNQYYINGFIQLLNIFKHHPIKNIFYPSSVAVEELPANMGEYSISKLSSEMLCDFLEKNNNDLITFKPRFPRMATDQTASIMPINNIEPTSYMLVKLQEFQKKSLR